MCLIRTIKTGRAATELIALLVQHEVAPFSGLDIGGLELRQPLRTEIQPLPALTILECVRQYARASRADGFSLHSQQQLTAQHARLIMQKFFEIEHARTEPRQAHAADNRAYAHRRVVIQHERRLIARNNCFLAGVAHAGPQAHERVRGRNVVEGWRWRRRCERHEGCQRDTDASHEQQAPSGRAHRCLPPFNQAPLNYRRRERDLLAPCWRRGGHRARTRCRGRSRARRKHWGYRARKATSHPRAAGGGTTWRDRCSP